MRLGRNRWDQQTTMTPNKTPVKLSVRSSTMKIKTTEDYNYIGVWIRKLKPDSLHWIDKCISMQYHCREINKAHSACTRMCISQAWVLWKLWISGQIADWINLSCNWAINKYWSGLFFLIINLTRASSGGGIFFKHLYEALLFIKSQIHMNLTTQPTLQPAENVL